MWERELKFRKKERKQGNKEHLLSGSVDKLGHKKNPSKQGTYFLESTNKWTSQDMEKIQVSKGHSQTKEHRWIDKLRHGKNSS